MPIEAVLFDLDGTLLDTLRDIADAANQVLRDVGLPTHDIDAYRHYVGDGVARLFERAIADSPQRSEQVERCVAAFGGIYQRQWDATTRPYDGIAELLSELSNRGVALAILSNKPDEFTQLCVQRYFPTVCFRPVLGHRVGHPCKPDPDGALEIAEMLGIPPGRFLYLGDTNVDMRTAIASGMVPVGAAWGFRDVDELLASGARVVIHKPDELLPLLVRADLEPG